MERRLFIAINLPENIKAEIRKEMELDNKTGIDLYQNANMIPEENWHITLKFFGSQPEEHIETIGQVIRNVIGEREAPVVTIRTLSTAPPHRPPRMIWATTTTETNKVLGSIKETIERKLAVHAIFQKGETFPIFQGHITLARLPEGRRIAERIVSFPNALTFRPITIDLMESHLESTGAEYSILKSIDFKPSI